MKKIFALLALFAFIGVASTPVSATVIDNIDNTVQIAVDNDNAVITINDQDPVKKNKKSKKSTTKVTKSSAKAGSCCGSSVKSGCGESKEGCGEAHEGCEETKKEGKKETKKKTL